MSSNVLAARDVNAPLNHTSPEKKTDKMQSLEYHRQALHARLNEGEK